MVETKILIPKRRFRDFQNAGVWEQRKLSELAFVYDGTHQTPRYTSKGVMFLSVENIKSMKSNKYISIEDFKNDFKVFPEKGDVLMTRIGDIGTANLYDSDEPIAYYVSLALLKKKDLDPHYLKEVIECDTVQKELWHRTLHIAFPKKINKNEIEKVIVPYPKEKLEQVKIGKLFNEIDNLITLHQRKLDKIKSLKKAYLYEMFPAVGETKPKRRFKGFSGDWEQRKLGDIAIELVAGGDIKKGLIKTSGKYPVFANALTNEGVVGYYDDDYRIKAPAVTITGRGYVGHARARKVHFTPVVRLLTLITKHDVDFMENAINQLNIVIESTGVPQLTVPQLARYEIKFPSNKEEEIEIGAFFKHIDNLITLHQNKLDKLKNLKKSYLNEMFV